MTAAYLCRSGLGNHELSALDHRRRRRGACRTPQRRRHDDGRQDRLFTDVSKHISRRSPHRRTCPSSSAAWRAPSRAGWRPAISIRRAVLSSIAGKRRRGARCRPRHPHSAGSCPARSAASRRHARRGNAAARRCSAGLATAGTSSACPARTANGCVLDGGKVDRFLDLHDRRTVRRHRQAFHSQPCGRGCAGFFAATIPRSSPPSRRPTPTRRSPPTCRSACGPGNCCTARRRRTPRRRLSGTLIGLEIAGALAAAGTVDGVCLVASGCSRCALSRQHLQASILAPGSSTPTRPCAPAFRLPHRQSGPSDRKTADMNRIPFPPMKYPLIAILRGLKPEETEGVVGTLIEAGFTAIEIPLNSPDPFRSIETAVKMAPPGCLIGAGTVLTTAQVEQLADVGGRLMVSPNVEPAVIRLAAQKGMVDHARRLHPDGGARGRCGRRNRPQILPGKRARPFRDRRDPHRAADRCRSGSRRRRVGGEFRRLCQDRHQKLRARIEPLQARNECRRRRQARRRDSQGLRRRLRSTMHER